MATLLEWKRHTSINNLLTGLPLVSLVSPAHLEVGHGAWVGQLGGDGGSQGGAAAGGTPGALKQVGIHASSSVCVCEAVAVTLADIHKFVTCTRETLCQRRTDGPPVGPRDPNPPSSLGLVTLTSSTSVRRHMSTDVGVSALFTHFNRGFSLNAETITVVSSGWRQNSSYCHLNCNVCGTSATWAEE